jgi:mono/diheme cytochrome c family protein
MAQILRKRSTLSVRFATNTIMEKSTMKVKSNRGLALVCCTSAAVMIAGVMSLVVFQPAAATAQFAAQTGKSCADCHTDPKGGGALTAFGEKFKANGNKLPK